MKLQLFCMGFLFLEFADAIDNFGDISFGLDMEAQVFGSLFGISDKYRSDRNGYSSFLLDISPDLKILKDDVHNCGLAASFVFDRNFDELGRKAELYRSYFYYIFDYWGELRIGSERDAVYFSKVIDGSDDNLGLGSKYSRYIFPHIGEDWFSDLYCVGDNDTANKVLWISPKVSGWKVSLSYTPDSGKSHFCSGSGKFLCKNVFAGALSYDRGDEDGFRYNAVIAGYLGKAKKEVRDLSAYLLGLGFGYKGFNMNLNYINNKKSLCGLDRDVSAGKIIKYNLSYNFDRFSIYGGGSFSYGYRNIRKKRKLDIKKIGFEYFVNNLLTILCEYRIIKTYTTTLKKLGDKHNVFIAEFKFKKLWNVL